MSEKTGTTRPKKSETHVSSAFKFRLDPTPDQRILLASHAGAARWAYNFALSAKYLANQRYHVRRKALLEAGFTLEEATAALRGKEPIPMKPTIQKMFNRVKGSEKNGIAGEFPWHDTPGREISTYAFQSAFADADQAFANYFASITGRRQGRRMRRPRFKKKGRATDSFRLHHDVTKPTIRLDGYRRVILPRIGSVRLHDPRLAKKLTRLVGRRGGHISSATVSRAGDHWYVSVLVNTPRANIPAVRATRRQQTRGVVGVDLGVALMAATSDGELVDRLKPARDAHDRLVKAQRALSRTKKGSVRRRKAARKVARIHHAVALKRAGAQHQFTASLTRTSAVVVLEDLRVSNMVRRPDPKPDETLRSTGGGEPARFLPNGARSKAGLNRSILDVGWGEIRRQLEYKSVRHGATVATVNPANTSRECNQCHHIAVENRKSQADFRCVQCGHLANADVNAARNIRDRYLRQAGVVRPAQAEGTPVPAPPGVLAEASAQPAGKPLPEAALLKRPEDPTRSTGGSDPTAFPNTG